AQWWARNEASPATQYIGLGLYVVATAVIMCPLLWICSYLLQAPQLIPIAGLLTLAIVGGLVATAFVTRKDFSGLYPILMVGAFLALGIVLAAVIFGFTVGLWYSVALVALMGGFVLYQTSSLIHDFPTHLPVAAALMLFASIATMFYHILRILLLLNSRD